jgi:pimeloyl-ACP methyl ester carboxylesterase
LECWYDFGYASELRNRYRLILFDARGHGASDKPHNSAAYDLKCRVDDVVVVLDSLGIDKAYYLGYSMGGWVGFGVARYATERFHSIILGGAHPYSQRLDGLRQIVQHGIEHGTEEFIDAWEKTFGPTTERQKKCMRLWDFKALLDVSQDRPDLSIFLPMMTIPWLIFVGELDDVYPFAKEGAQHMPNATFSVLPRLDHSCIRRLDLLMPLITRFLD